MLTSQLANQFVSAAIAIAECLGPCENNSAVIIQGIEPGPTAKNTTNANVKTTARYEIQSRISLNKEKKSFWNKKAVSSFLKIRN